MNINAIIHEQIDWDGTAKAFQLRADQSIGDLWIAFPSDYEGERDSPFFFLDKEYETIFRSRQANCRQIKLAAENFYRQADDYVFETTWQRIPTERQALTYYALYLPEYAIPSSIRITDTRDNSREFSKNVFRDDQKCRYVIYLECASRFGQFNFNLSCRFRYDEGAFYFSKYKDEKTVGFYADLEHWKWTVPDNEARAVEQFFVTHHNTYMRDQYNIQQAAAVGPNATAHDNTFNQQNNPLPANTDYEKLAIEISQLKSVLLSKASNGDHYKAIGEIAQAEEAAKEGNGNKVLKFLGSAGKWALDAVKDIGTDVLAEVIKKQLEG